MQLLKVLVKEVLPEVNQKINELGLPIEFYFARPLLELLTDLFGLQLQFRLWDIIIYETSLPPSANSMSIA